MLNRNVQITAVENDFTRERKWKPLRITPSSVSSEASCFFISGSEPKEHERSDESTPHHLTKSFLILLPFTKTLSHQLHSQTLK